MKTYYEEDRKRISTEEKYRKRNRHPLWNDNYFRIGLTAIIVFIICILIYYFMFHSASILNGIKSLSRILRPVFVGLVIAYLLTPILNYIQYQFITPLADKIGIEDNKKRDKFLRGISILITAILAILVLYLIISMLIKQIVPSLISLFNNLDSYTENIINWGNKLLQDNLAASTYFSNIIDRYSKDIEIWFNENIMLKVSDLVKTLSLSVVGFIKGVWNFIIGFIISIYVLGGKERLSARTKKIIYALFSREHSNSIIESIRFTNKTFSGFIGGKVLDSLIIGLICFIVTTIIRTPYAALVSLVIGVTNIIPFFGPYLGAIPTTLLILIVDMNHPMNVVYYVIFILILQQFDGNILGPKILGESTGLAGFWVIFSITLFGGLFGVVGMIVGVPVFAVIYAGVRKWIDNNLTRKNMPHETRYYEDLDYINEEGSMHYMIPDHRNPELQKDKSVKAAFPTFLRLFSRKNKKKKESE